MLLSWRGINCPVTSPGSCRDLLVWLSPTMIIKCYHISLPAGAACPRSEYHLRALGDTTFITFTWCLIIVMMSDTQICTEIFLIILVLYSWYRLFTADNSLPRNRSPSLDQFYQEVEESRNFCFQFFLYENVCRHQVVDWKEFEGLSVSLLNHFCDIIHQVCSQCNNWMILSPIKWLILMIDFYLRKSLVEEPWLFTAWLEGAGLELSWVKLYLL